MMMLLAALVAAAVEDNPMIFLALLDWEQHL